MSKVTEEKKNTIAGLDQATNRKDAEYDLVAALLSAAEYKEDENNILDVEIRRNGRFLFTVSIHPLGDRDVKFARKKATTYGKNPNGKGYAPIEKDFDNVAFSSWMIYLATTEDDQQRIWGNPALKQKGIMEPWEAVDLLLTVGEKRELQDKVFEISGLNDDGEEDENENMSKEEYAKN